MTHLQIACQGFTAAPLRPRHTTATARIATVFSPPSPNRTIQHVNDFSLLVANNVKEPTLTARFKQAD